MSWPLSELTQHPIVQSIYTRMIINKAKLYSTIAKQTRRTEPRSYNTIPNKHQEQNHAVVTLTGFET
jgi:hypothetical protein